VTEIYPLPLQKEGNFDLTFELLQQIIIKLMINPAANKLIEIVSTLNPIFELY